MRLWRRDAAAVAAHRAAGVAHHRQGFNGRHEAQLALVTTDIAEAVRDAELILCPAPRFRAARHRALLAPHLRDGQVVFLPPATFGSMIFAKAAHDAGNHAEVELCRDRHAALADAQARAVRGRHHHPRQTAAGRRISAAAEADHALEVIGRAFPGVIEPCGDALSGALMNAGPIIHPPLIVMNAGPIEHFERWDIHKEGTQAVDPPRHRRARCRAHRGARRPRLWRAAFSAGAPLRQRRREWMYGRGSHDRLTDFGDWRERIVLTEHRYMREDLRLGLSFLVSAAELAGVATPLAKAFLAIGGAICGEDFMQRRPHACKPGARRSGPRAACRHFLREGFRR